MSDDDNYVFDADGNRIFVGLTLDEKREFECLDELISRRIRRQSVTPVNLQRRYSD